ncbi:YcxB family protein [Leptospira kemamanensis]|uniref:YcxB family protein n=1 Tax=Leptospira kemamanensis TaxID=2484942 RepID=A0A4V3JQ00_9LEPT|nr:YcxB family protein [Leptospira kemamanensis]TGL51320.1 YcxB family protein [Leptospira kemamanensis]
MKEIRYIQTLEDLTSFSLHHHNRFGSMYQKYYPEIFLSITSTISAVMFFNSYPEEINYLAIVYLFLNILYYVYLRLTRKRKLINHFKKFYTEGREFKESELTIRFEDTYILTVTENVESKIPYEKLTRISKGNEALYIYLSNTQALVLPRRVFHSPSERQANIDFLLQKNENLSTAN